MSNCAEVLDKSHFFPIDHFLYEHYSMGWFRQTITSFFYPSWEACSHLASLCSLRGFCEHCCLKIDSLSRSCLLPSAELLIYVKHSQAGSNLPASVYIQPTVPPTTYKLHAQCTTHTVHEVQCPHCSVSRMKPFTADPSRQFWPAQTFNMIKL